MEINIKGFQCRHCPFDSDSRSSFVKHLLRHSILKDTLAETNNYEANVQWFSCDQCSFKSRLRIYLDRHLRNHTKHERNPIITITHSFDSNFEESDNWYKCEQCSYKSRLRTYLDRHLRSHSQREHNPITYSVQRNCEQNPLWYECEHCPYKSGVYGRFEQHVRIHKDVGPSLQPTIEVPLFADFKSYTCRPCELVFNSLLVYRKHFKSCTARAGRKRKRHHKHPTANTVETDQVQWFACEHCPFKSRFRADMEQHLSDHGDEQKSLWEQNYRSFLKSYSRACVLWYYCDRCSYLSRNEYDLRVHKLHSHVDDDLIFRCEHCPFVTMVEEDLSRHKANVHMVQFPKILFSETK